MRKTFPNKQTPSTAKKERQKNKTHCIYQVCCFPLVYNILGFAHMYEVMMCLENLCRVCLFTSITAPPEELDHKPEGSHLEVLEMVGLDIMGVGGIRTGICG